MTFPHHCRENYIHFVSRRNGYLWLEFVPQENILRTPRRPNEKETHRRVTAVIVLWAALAVADRAGAQDWPTRPVSMIVPYAAGGPVDVLGRIMAQRLDEILGRPVVVENVTGAGGMTGTNRVAKAAP